MKSMAISHGITTQTMFDMGLTLPWFKLGVLSAVACYKYTYAVYAILVYLFYRGITSHYFYQVRSSLVRDLSGLALLVTVKMNIRKRLIANQPLHEIFLHTVSKYRDKVAFIEVETGQSFTFDEFNQHCNKYAHYFQSEGYKSEQVISLFLENCADFPAVWLGLSKIGVITAWINTNLTAVPLVHSISASKSKSVITSKKLYPAIKEIFESGKLSEMKVYVLDDESEVENGVVPLRSKVKSCSSSEPIADKKPTFKSVLCYIFTSGTTGNPKPALIRHYRYYWMSMGVSKSFGIHTDDRIYVMMPIYHSAGGILGIGQSILQGCTTVIRHKFSASNFWKDCVKYNCTVGQYIGEICRYLLAQKEIKEERDHKVRLMFGNGLRAEIWSQFIDRFGIEKIGELYGSTEGNSSIVNIDNQVGSCGFIPVHPYVKYLYPLRLLKIDSETGELLRDPNGLCVSCRPGEIGEMAGAIVENQPLLSFEGYLDKEDTGKKIIRDVLRKGDAAFTTGDIMQWDDLGYLYFKDRRGDTYRWKGENVSTTEVEGVLQLLKTLMDVAVYGVSVPHREGCAGMVAVTVADNYAPEDVINEIAKHVVKNLPPYAIPVFIRFCKDFDRTGTYKLKKLILRSKGFDLCNCDGERIYIWDSTRKLYKEMDDTTQRKVEQGTYIGI